MPYAVWQVIPNGAACRFASLLIKNEGFIEAIEEADTLRSRENCNPWLEQHFVANSFPVTRIPPIASGGHRTARASIPDDGNKLDEPLPPPPPPPYSERNVSTIY